MAVLCEAGKPFDPVTTVLRNQVAVDVNGRLDRGVAELLFDEGGRDPLLDQDGRVGMAQGVRGQLAQAGLGE